MNRRWFSVSLFVIASLAVSMPLSAQLGARRPLDFGVKGGLSLPTFFWTGDNSWNDVTNFAIQGEAYAFACVNVNPRFGVEIEAGYRGKGCSVDASDGYVHWYMDYLEVPVWAKFSAPMGRNLSLYGGIGGYAAWFLGRSIQFLDGCQRAQRLRQPVRRNDGRPHGRASAGLRSPARGGRPIGQSALRITLLGKRRPLAGIHAAARRRRRRSRSLEQRHRSADRL